ncbi:MAG: NADH-quinone oxidoreductase subunit C [Verrucomicrobia bacterium]|nr:MAG: NADH-quinone oxidoreductase subunit C [Verrucomicrobiota bacterium]
MHATIEKLKAKFGAEIGELPEFRGEFGVTVARAKILDVCRFLKTECGFDMLTDLSGVDNLGAEPRFEVHYLLYSLTRRQHLRLVVGVPADAAVVESVVSVWSTADWHEREAFDMFGISFRGHPNLTRIIMWEGYPHHPLRKDFPLAGLPAELPATAQNAGAVQPAPMEGGPFVASIGTAGATRREPRVHDTAAERDATAQQEGI